MAIRQAYPSLVAELIDRFKALFDASPPWAWPFKPSVPLVGERYRPDRGLLIYASAENFAWMRNKHTLAWFRPAAGKRGETVTSLNSVASTRIPARKESADADANGFRSRPMRAPWVI